MQINIKKTDDLLKCFDTLHDSVVEEEAICYNKEKKSFDMLVERDILEKDSLSIEKNYWFFKKYSHPVLKSNLHLESVIKFDKYSRDRSLKLHTFNRCKRDKGNTFVLEFCEVLQIIILLENEPNGYLIDLESDTPHKRSFWQFSFPFSFSLSKK